MKRDINGRNEFMGKIKCLVTISESFTRDIQIAPNKEADVSDSNWIDYQGEVVLGMFEGNSKKEILDNIKMDNELLNIYELKVTTNKSYVVYGDYEEELQDNTFRNDLKILGFITDKKDEENALMNLLNDCGIENIYDYEEASVKIAEINLNSEKCINLSRLEG